jgi:hypothetical protein
MDNRVEGPENTHNGIALGSRTPMAGPIPKRTESRDAELPSLLCLVFTEALGTEARGSDPTVHP